MIPADARALLEREIAREEQQADPLLLSFLLAVRADQDARAEDRAAIAAMLSAFRRDLDGVGDRLGRRAANAADQRMLDLLRAHYWRYKLWLVLGGSALVLLTVIADRLIG